jgi:hypothetical protein
MALAANLYHIVWWWQGQGKSGGEGWTVQRSGSSPAAILDAVNSIMLKRSQCLGRSGALIGARCSQLTDNVGARVRRISEFREFYYPGTQVDAAGDPYRATPRFFDLLLHCFDPSNKSKNQFMGLPPQQIFPGDNQYVPTATWTASFNALTEMYLGASFGWIGQTPVGPADSPTIPYLIQTYTQDAATGKVTLELNVDVTQPFVANLRPFAVNIAYTGKHPLDGRKVVTLFVDPQTGVPIPNKLVTVDPIGVRSPVLSGVGVLRVLDSFFYKFDGSQSGSARGRIAAVKPSEHKRGNSFPSGRGRIPRRALW